METMVCPLNVFLNDLEVFMNDTPVLFKYADDSTIVAPVWKDSGTSADLVNQFLSWSINLHFRCNLGYVFSSFD